MRFYVRVMFEEWVVRKNFRNSVEWIQRIRETQKIEVSVGFSYCILSQKKFSRPRNKKTSSLRNFFEFNTMEGQYIFGQSNGKPTFLSIDTGKTFSLEDKGEWISGWKDGKQCWFNTATKETSFSSPVKVQNNDILPTAIQITDEEILSMMDIDIEEPESKKRKVKNMGAEEKKKRRRENARKFRQKNKKKLKDSQNRVMELEASIMDYKNAVTIRDEKIKLLESRLAFLESIVTSEMMRRNEE